MATKKRLIKKRNKKLGIGIAVGTAVAAGAAAAFLLGTKKGKQIRKDFARQVKTYRKQLESIDIEHEVKEIFGEVTDQTKGAYEGVKQGLAERLAQVKDQVGEVTFDKYKKAVEDVVGIAKKKVLKESKRADVLRKDLLAKWAKLEDKTQKSVKKTVAKTAKKVAKASKGVAKKKSPAKKK